jgi:hypothetical protein
MVEVYVLLLVWTCCSFSFYNDLIEEGEEFC